jgi:GTPase SAR1 family protein
MLQHCLIDGQSVADGWGSSVREKVLPLLQGHEPLETHQRILRDGFERAASPVSVFIVGEGNFGKSTLVNALLGVDAAPVDFMPLTWHITRYVPLGSEPRFVINYDRSCANSPEFEAVCREHDPLAKLVPGIVELTGVEQILAIVQVEERRRETDPQWKSPIWQVVRSVKSPVIRPQPLEVVDTPGIGQIRQHAAVQDSMDDFYHRADLVLWLFNAEIPNSRETREKLESMSRYGKPIVGVVNRADLIPKQQRAAVRDFVLREFGEHLADLVLISALEGLQARQSNNNELFQSSGLAELEDKLVSFVSRFTKAISFYNTCTQASAEVRRILRAEADLAERNLEVLDKQNAIATTFADRAGAHLTTDFVQELSAAVHSAASVAMEETKDIEGFHGVPYRPSAVRIAVEQACRQSFDALYPVIDGELSAVLDEINELTYARQSYHGDGSVRATAAVPTVETYPLRFINQIEMPSIADLLSEREAAIRAVLDGTAGAYESAKAHGKRFFAAALDTIHSAANSGSQRRSHEEIQKAESEAERIRRENLREREFRRALADLPRIADATADRLAGALSKEIAGTVKCLQARVEIGFGEHFDTSLNMKRRVIVLREKADAAVVPPALLYSVTKMLKAVCVAGHR